MISEKIIAKIARDYNPEKIILFGSQARGEADAESDFDLIVIKETDEPFVRRAVNFPDLPFRADVFVYTPEEFAKMQKEGSLFLENALRESTVIYDKQGTRVEALA